MSAGRGTATRGAPGEPRAVAYLDGGKVNVKGMVRIFVSPCTV